MSAYGHLESCGSVAADGHPARYVRPGALLSRIGNPVAVALGRKTVLSVRGRKSGKLIRVPMDAPFAWHGSRYLVSPRGETHWARNLRAAGEADLRTRGRSEHIHVTELHGTEHDAIVESYASTITCNCRLGMALLPDPADHPVFRIDPSAG